WRLRLRHPLAARYRAVRCFPTRRSSDLFGLWHHHSFGHCLRQRRRGRGAVHTRQRQHGFRAHSGPLHHHLEHRWSPERLSHTQRRGPRRRRQYRDIRWGGCDRQARRTPAGNLAVSGDFTFLTLSPPDTTAPAVSLTAPAANSSASGTITVAATALDNVGVVGVQFKLDSANLGPEDTTNTYSLSWDTTAVSN